MAAAAVVAATQQMTESQAVEKAVLMEAVEVRVEREAPLRIMAVQVERMAELVVSQERTVLMERIQLD